MRCRCQVFVVCRRAGLDPGVPDTHRRQGRRVIGVADSARRSWRRFRIRAALRRPDDKDYESLVAAIHSGRVRAVEGL